MKVKRLLEILKTKDPDADVEVVTTDYNDPEDSIGYEQERDVEGVLVLKNKVQVWATFHNKLEK